MRRAGRPPRVLLGTVEIAGFYSSLRAGLQELGVPATLYTAALHPFGYPGEEDGDRVALIRWMRAAYRRYNAAAARGSWTRFGWRALTLALRPPLLAWAALRFDAFIFGIGTCITGLPRLEFPLLRLLGRRVVCVFHGSDTRPPYLDGFVMVRDATLGPRDYAALAVAARRRAVVAGRFAACTVDNPASAHFHQRPCVNGLILGLPVPPRDPQGDVQAEVPAPAGGTVRVLHSPSAPEAKGTAVVVAAIERLRAGGHDVELVMVTGQPHAVVMRELARCDFVVDQLYSDTPMAGFAAEAASLGKPAVVGGYAGEVFARWLPDEHRPPTVYVHPDEVESAIERLVADAELRRELGRRALAWARERCTPRSVAGRYLRLLEGTVPPEWMFDPREIRYPHGAGAPEPRVRAMVRAIVEQLGPGALRLDDKPELERLVVEFGRGGGAGDAAAAAPAGAAAAAG